MLALVLDAIRDFIAPYLHFAPLPIPMRHPV